jgi:predicted nucleotidyltransferase
MSLQQVKRKPKDRDFFQTREGMFFCVTGYLHPPDRYTAYLKYAPASSGKWRRGGISYQRQLPYYHVNNVAETIRYLERRYPHYVYDCPVRGIRFSMVPRSHVARYYAPRERMREILAGPRDLLEEEVHGMAMELVACVGIRPDDLGITGSILIGLHNPDFSDIDLLVYGQENARKVRAALRGGQSSKIRPPGREQSEQWSLRIAGRFSLSQEEARYVASRRWNYGFYGERYFSIHPTRTDAEITEEYGDHVYRGLGVARVRAVVEAEESLFMPAAYRVESVQVVEGNPEAAGVREIVSYEGLYREAADVGQQIEAYGKLESVDGIPRRLVIGTTMSRGEGYVKPVIGEGCGDLTHLFFCL